MINDLFEYTRLTSGNVTLHKQEIDMHQLLEQMVVEFEPLAARSSVTIQSQLAEAPLPVSVDPDKIARALDNLLVNALKFSVRPGIIKVTLKTEGKWAVLSVGNAGQAITEEQASRIFERFFYADNTVDNGSTARGTGLGLSIAKNIVELHGGKIWLEYKDCYYEFFIKLPANFY